VGIVANVSMYEMTISYNLNGGGLRVDGPITLNISNTTIWGNDLVGIDCLGGGAVIDASLFTSIYLNNLQSPPTLPEITCNANCSIVLPYGGDGCGGCPSSKLDQCGVCGGNGSLCTFPNCAIPWTPCSPLLSQFPVENCTIATTNGLTSGYADVTINAVELATGQISLGNATAQFSAIREVDSQTGNVLATWPLDDGKFLQGISSYVSEAQGNEIFEVIFARELPNGAFLTISQSLSGSAQPQNVGSISFTVNPGFEKISITLQRWPSLTSSVELDMILHTDSVTSVSSGIIGSYNTGNSYINENTFYTSSTDVFLSLATFFVPTPPQSASLTSNLTYSISPLNSNSRNVTFHFKGPFTSFLYDPDLSVLLASSSGDGTSYLALEIVLPIVVVLMGILFGVLLAVSSFFVWRRKKRLGKVREKLNTFMMDNQQ
jgi:hypothetical protein